MFSYLTVLKNVQPRDLPYMKLKTMAVPFMSFCIVAYPNPFRTINHWLSNGHQCWRWEQYSQTIRTTTWQLDPWNLYVSLKCLIIILLRYPGICMDVSGGDEAKMDLLDFLFNFLFISLSNNELPAIISHRISSCNLNKISIFCKMHEGIRLWKL